MPTPKRSTAKKSTPKKSTARKSTTKKTTPKKAAPKKTVLKKKKVAPKKDTAPLSEESVSYTLTELAARYGDATHDEIFALVSRDRARLIADGAQVSTARIAIDCARLYGRAGDFYAKADARQKQGLRGFDSELLRMATYAALRGQELAETRRREEASGADRQAQRQGAAQALRKSAVVRRDQLAALLRLASGGDGKLRDEIERKSGRITTPELLAQALAELSALGRRFLKGGDAALKQRAARAGLDSAYLDETEALSSRVTKELKAGAAVRESARVTQSEVDLWDGLNLFLLERIIELFEVAHAIEPTVPRLVPLSLRTWFGRTAKPAAPTPPAPSPTPA